MKLVRFEIHVPGAWSEENMVPDEHGDWVNYHSVSARIAELETALTQAANVMVATSSYMYGKQAEFLLKSADVANSVIKGSK